MSATQKAELTKPASNKKATKPAPTLDTKKEESKPAAPTREQLIAAANDMNEKMGLDPAINVKINAVAIARAIMQNAAELDFSDFDGSKAEDEQISDDTKTTLTALGFKVPAAPAPAADKKNSKKSEAPATKPAKVKSAKEMKAEKAVKKETKKERAPKYTRLNAFTDTIHKKCVKGATFADILSASDALYSKHNGDSDATTEGAKKSRLLMVLGALVSFDVLTIDKSNAKPVYKLTAE